MNLDTCLRSIQSLLTDAVPDDPQVRLNRFDEIQDYVVSVVYCNDYEKYKKVAQEWTEKYASKEYISENEKTVHTMVIVHSRLKSSSQSMEKNL